MRNYNLGKLFGVNVYLNIWLLVFLAIMLLFNGVNVCLFLILAFFCVLLHEYGHIFAAKYYGIKCQKIILSPLGGMAFLNYKETAKNYKPLREFIIMAAGPSINLLISFIGLFSLMFTHMLYVHSIINATSSFYITGFFRSLIGINIVLLIFNLLPAYPMDGGKMFKAILASFLSYKKAGRIAGITGMIFGVLMILFFMMHLSITGILIGGFVTFLAYSEYYNNKNIPKNIVT